MSVESTNCERCSSSVQQSRTISQGAPIEQAAHTLVAQAIPIASKPCENSALWKAGRFEELRQRLTADLAGAEALDDQQELLDVTNDLACVFRALGDQTAAAQFQTQAAVRESNMLGSGRLSATSLSNLACDALLAGDLPIAEGLFWKSLLVELGSGNASGAAADWANLGLLAGLQGDHEESRYRLWEALKLHRRSGDDHGMAMDLWHLGQSFEESAAWSISARLFERAERKFTETDNVELCHAARVRKQLARAREQVFLFDVGRN